MTYHHPMRNVSGKQFRTEGNRAIRLLNNTPQSHFVTDCTIVLDSLEYPVSIEDASQDFQVGNLQVQTGERYFLVKSRLTKAVKVQDSRQYHGYRVDQKPQAFIVVYRDGRWLSSAKDRDTYIHIVQRVLNFLKPSTSIAA